MPGYVDEVADLITPHVPLERSEVLELMGVPPDPRLGDYAFPCFRLARAMGSEPAAIAARIRDGIRAGGLPASVAEVVAAGPFLNFVIDQATRARDVLTAVREAGDAYGGGTEGQGKTVVIDYSHPNIAKPCGVQHLRSTVIGAALYRIYGALGWRCVGVNHLGDWGTQFGKTITAYKKWGQGAPEEQSAEDLYELYVRFHRAAEADPELETEAREWHRRMEEGDEEALAMWSAFREASLNDFRRIYRTLEVDFDSWAGESFYVDRLPATVRLAVERGVAKEDDGALIVDMSEYGLGVWLLQKSDGTTLYSTRDLAAAIYRAEEYNFDLLLYVVGAPQAQHFSQLFKALELLGFGWADRCVHVSFGQILGMSTRRGTLVFLEEVLEQAIRRAAQIIAERNPELEDAEEAAKRVGVGAIVYADLSRRRGRDYTFDWDEVLNFDGETGPYLQYTHARLCSILRKFERPVPDEYDPGLLAMPEETACIKALESFPAAVRRAAAEYEPHLVASHLIGLATAANAFYQKHRVIDDSEPALTSARIVLVDALRQVLRNGLLLLGIYPLERM